MNKDSWLLLSCPYCKITLRIRAAYGHMRGRCPECGLRIEPVQPRALPPHVISASDEPMGLAPIEEEWPEPAQLDAPEGEVRYGISQSALLWEESAPETSPQGETYVIREEDYRPPVPSAAPTEEVPYDMRPTDAAALPPLPMPAIPEHIIEALIRQPPPPPPKLPMLLGIYEFPIRPRNILMTLLVAGCFTLMALLFFLVYMLFEIGGLAWVGIPPLVPVIVIFGVAIGVQVSSTFLTIVEETAAGSDVVNWPKELAFTDNFWKLFYLGWVAICSITPRTLLWIIQVDSVLGQYRWVLAFVPPLLFPVFLLSSMSAGSSWNLLSLEILRCMLKRPMTMALLWLPSLGMFMLFLWLAEMAFVQLTLGMVPVLGLACGVFVLIYGRLLGRVGWRLTLGDLRKKRKKRRLAPIPGREGGNDENEAATSYP